MKDAFDVFQKELLPEAIRVVARVQTDVRVLSEPLSADLYSVPFAEPDPERVWQCGVLGRMVALGPCFWEPHSTNPRAEDIIAALRKLWSVIDTSTSSDIVDPPELTWLVSSGRPGTMLQRFGCDPLPSWPPGFYAATAEPRLRMVVVIELPRRRDTLLLRLLGRNTTLLTALDDLQALPDDAFESRLAKPVVLRWARYMNEAAGHELAWLRHEQDEESVIMRAREWLDQELRQEREKGLQPLVHLFERRLGRELERPEREMLLRRLDVLGPERVGDVVLDLSPEALEAWLAEADAE